MRQRFEPIPQAQHIFITHGGSLIPNRSRHSAHAQMLVSLTYCPSRSRTSQRNDNCAPRAFPDKARFECSNFRFCHVTVSWLQRFGTTNPRRDTYHAGFNVNPDPKAPASQSISPGSLSAVAVSSSLRLLYNLL
jgi:hypothetical protein